MKLDKLPSITGNVQKSDLHQNLSVPKQILLICLFSSSFPRCLGMLRKAEITSHGLWLSVENTIFSYILYTLKLYLLEKG